MIEVERRIDSGRLDPVRQDKVIPSVPQEFHLPGDRLPLDHVAGNKRVDRAAPGAEIYLAELVPEEMDRGDGIADPGQQDLMVIGIEGRTGRDRRYRRHGPSLRV